jgi:hypothetical protein
MRPHVKILFGVVLVIVGIYWYALDIAVGTGVSNLAAIAILFKGGFGIIVALLGTFIVWIESDELRIQRELERHDLEPQEYSEGSDSLAATSEEDEDTDDGEMDGDDDSMSYASIVEGTVDEVKEQVKSEDLDSAKVLAAEKEGKDRTTLTDWLERRIED